MAAPREHPHLLVVIDADGLAPSLVSYGDKLRRALGAQTWSVVALETLDRESRPAADRAALLAALERAEALGANVSRVSTGSYTATAAVSAIVHRVQSEGADILLIGRPRPRGLWAPHPRTPSEHADAIGALLPGVTVHMIHAAAPAGVGAETARPSRSGPHAGWGLAAVVVAACTAVCAALEPLFHPANLVMVYLAGVVFVATRSGRTAAVAAVFGSVFVYDLLFVAPRWSLKPTEEQYWLALPVMLAVGLIIATLAARGREQAATAEARAQRAHALTQFALRLANARRDDAVIDELRAALKRALGVEAVVVRAEGGRVAALPAAALALGAERARAEQALREGRAIEARPSRGDGGSCRYLPLAAGAEPIGVVVIEPLRPPLDTLEDEHLARALTHQAAVALERALAEQRGADAAVSAEHERTRNTMLAAISHDFRTPLTTIMASATTLIEQGGAIDAAQRLAVLHDLLAEAQRLHVLSSNLLELTRIEGGAIRPEPEWCPVDELFAEAQAALRGRLSAHRVDWEAPADALVWCDPRLVGQVLVNLIDNAVRHTPAGGHIRVRIDCAQDNWSLVVHDEGPGVAPGQEASVFRKFHRSRHEGDSGGKGLGLAICAAVAGLHGGSIAVTHERGARFEMRLPQPVAPRLREPELA